MKLWEPSADLLDPKMSRGVKSLLLHVFTTRTQHSFDVSADVAQSDSRSISPSDVKRKNKRLIGF